MKIKYGYFYFLLMLTWTTQAQSKYSIFINSGYTFNKELELREKTVQQSKGYSIDLGINYIPWRSKFGTVEAGVSGKIIFASGKLQNDRFQASTFRLNLPLKLVFSIPNTKLQGVTGAIFQNNVDFSEFDFRLRDKYSWRINYAVEVRYLWKPRLAFTIAWQANLRDIPAPYFINDPKMSITIGIVKAIPFKNRKK